MVRNSNGSLSLLILDESPFTTAEQMSSDDIVFDDDNDNSYEHGVGDNYNDMKMGLVDTLAAGAGKTTTRQQHTTYEVDLSRPARGNYSRIRICNKFRRSRQNLITASSLHNVVYAHC